MKQGEGCGGVMVEQILGAPEADIELPHRRGGSQPARALRTRKTFEETAAPYK
jgi:hypothetical protein